MKTETVHEIFERYNPDQDVVRCPNRRAHVKKLIDSYARAAVNLYGIISREEFVDIFNRQNIDQTTREEIYMLLLPLVRKNAPYGFYKNYIVDDVYFADFDRAEDLLIIQGDKPRYIPEKTEFLQYAQADYSDNTSLLALEKFLWNEFGSGAKTILAMDEIMDHVVSGFHELGPIMNRYDLIFNTEQKLKEFLDLVMLASNNRRIRENKGHTPTELFNLTSQEKSSRPAPSIQKRTKVGRNDPCPCGSGKKFKKCCGQYDESKTAQLSTVECQEFYELWLGFLDYVNGREKVVKEKIKPEYPNAVSDVKIFEVRQVLWEKPQLLDEYISKAGLSKDKIDILKLWQTNFKKSSLIIVEYRPEYAVAIASNEGEDILYGIKGISTSLSNTLRLTLPAPIQTVLLPFKGKIIYDSFINSIQVGFGKGMRASIQENYDRLKNQGVTVSLK